MTDAPRPLDMPWRIPNEVRRLLALPFIRTALRLCGVSVRKGTRLYGMPRVQRHRHSRIHIAEGATLRSWPASNPLTPLRRVVLATRSPTAEIIVGPRSGLTGVIVVAESRVTIGADVFVGANVTITDTDFHPLHPAERRANPSAGRHRPVVIEDEVFIGMHSLILKGVTIGRGAVIGAGSVVTQDVAPYTVVAGNPAVVVRRLEPNPSPSLAAP